MAVGSLPVASAPRTSSGSVGLGDRRCSARGRDGVRCQVSKRGEIQELCCHHQQKTLNDASPNSDPTGLGCVCGRCLTLPRLLSLAGDLYVRNRDLVPACLKPRAAMWSAGAISGQVVFNIHCTDRFSKDSSMQKWFCSCAIKWMPWTPAWFCQWESL